MALVDWNEALHPRGQPENKGQFASKGGSGEEKAAAASAVVLALPAPKKAREVEYQGDTYRQFGAGEKIYNEFHDNLEGVTGVDLMNIERYIANPSAINHMLRSGAAETEGVAQELAGLCDRGRLSESVVAYRGIAGGFANSIDRLKPGETIRDAGFMSVTLRPLGMQQNMRVFVPEGSHGVVTGAHNAEGTAFDEIILARNSRLVFSGRGADGTPEFKLDQDVKDDVSGLDEAVIDVGGDVWNRETAIRLEREYVDARPKLDGLVKEMVGTEAAPAPSEESETPPESLDDFSQMSAVLQEDIASDYKQWAYDKEYEYEVENWNSEYAPKAARTLVATEYNDAVDKPEWAVEEIDAINTDRMEMFGEGPLPYSTKQLLGAITVDYDEDQEKVAIGFDDNKLVPPGWSTEQMELPGIEPPWPADLLTKQMREEITTRLIERFDKEGEDKESSLDAPEYLADSAKENVEESWDMMGDDEKTAWAKAHSSSLQELVKEMDQENIDLTGRVEIPTSFDPLGERDRTARADYLRTGRLARKLSLERSVQLIKERGIESKGRYVAGDEGWRGSVENMDAQLWSHWKGASHSAHGKLLQAAISEELGGRLKTTGQHAVDLEDTKRTAEVNYAGGFEAVKAYVRAKWETTQFLLEKANKPTLELYRGLRLEQTEKEKIEPITTSSGVFDRLSDVHVDRNGACSTTTDRKIANNWVHGEGDTCLRFKVPRTAVISVPAYGQNIHSEHEVIIGGLSFIGWDAWKNRAPDFEDVPLK